MGEHMLLIKHSLIKYRISFSDLYLFIGINILSKSIGVWNKLEKVIIIEISLRCIEDNDGL